MTITGLPACSKFFFIECKSARWATQVWVCNPCYRCSLAAWICDDSHGISALLPQLQSKSLWEAALFLSGFTVRPHSSDLSLWIFESKVLLMNRRCCAENRMHARVCLFFFFLLFFFFFVLGNIKPASQFGSEVLSEHHPHWWDCWWFKPLF